MSGASDDRLDRLDPREDREAPAPRRTRTSHSGGRRTGPRRTGSALVFALWLVVALISVPAIWPELPHGFPWVTSLAARVALGGMTLLLFVAVGVRNLMLARARRSLHREQVLVASLAARLDQLWTLVAATRAANADAREEEILGLVLESGVRMAGGSGGAIMLIEDGALEPAVSLGEWKGWRTTRLGCGPAGRVALSGDPLMIVEPGALQQEDSCGFPAAAAMCVPVVHGGKTLGVLVITGPPRREFSDEDLTLLMLLAEHTAMSIVTARMLEAERTRVSELLEVNRMKSDFVATVSHELRTPLTSILGSVITLQNLQLAREQQKEFLETIERQGRRLLRLIEQLLTTAQLERERPLRPFPKPVDVGVVVRMVARNFDLPSGSIEVVAPHSCEVVGDDDFLQQILVNLIDNACKHGKPPIRVLVEEEAEEVVISVIDAGPGVPAALRDRIFERFTRLEGSSRLPGIGLGLSIVRQLVSACGGRIWVEDAMDGGAVFRVALPARFADPAPTVPTEPARAAAPVPRA